MRSDIERSNIMITTLKISVGLIASHVWFMFMNTEVRFLVDTKI